MRPNGRLSFAAETKLRLEVLTGLWKIAKKDRKEICRKNVAVQEMQFCYTWTENKPQERNRREEYMSLACVTVACYLLFFYRPRQGNTRDFPPLLRTVQGAVQNEVLTFWNLTLYSSLWIDKIM